MEPSLLHQLLDFDVDRYLNPYVPHNRLYRLPKWTSYWLGYRAETKQEPYVVVQWLITILATIAGLCLLGGIGNHAPGIVELHPPVIIASMGASAVLCFNTIRSPLAQPRNAIIGNTLSAICGVGIAKLFQHSAEFSDIQWVSGAMGCALATWVMSLTNTIHPPGGATAVIASIDTNAIAMGWKFVPIVLLDSTLLVAVACVFNNLFRSYPTHWWTAQDTGRKVQQDHANEKAAEEGTSKTVVSDTSSDRTLQREFSNVADSFGGLDNIHITPYRLQLPQAVKLSDEEIVLLRNIQTKLQTSATFE